MPRRAAAAAALLLCLSAVACGAESPWRERGVVVLPVDAPGSGGAAAPLVLLHEQLAREVSRGATGAALLTTETPLVDYWRVCSHARVAHRRRGATRPGRTAAARAARRVLRVTAAALTRMRAVSHSREVLRTPHPVLLEAAPPAAQLPPQRCDGGGWRALRALGWSLGLSAALASAALNYAAARLWLRVLAPAAAAAARGTSAVAAAALAPAAAAIQIGSAMTRATSRAAMLWLEAAGCGVQLARECLSFMTGPPQRELPPTLRNAARNATAALQDADGAALRAAVASRVAPLRSLAAAACRVALAPARAAAGVLSRAPLQVPARDAPKVQAEAEAEAEPMLVPAGASRAVDGEISAEDASPRTADTRGPLHVSLHRLRGRQSSA